MLIDPALSFAFALPLASLLAASAIFHARDMRRFAAAIDAYRLLPLGAGSFVAPALIGIEAVIAAGLIAPSFRLEAGLAASEREIERHRRTIGRKPRHRLRLRFRPPRGRDFFGPCREERAACDRVSCRSRACVSAPARIPGSCFDRRFPRRGGCALCGI
jgi:hypothetical protein